MQQQQPGSQQQNVPAPNGIAGGGGGGGQQMNQMIGPGGAVSPASAGTTAMTNNRPQVNGGRFDFDDGGTYCGGWEDGKAHGHGVCTGPKGQGAYSGSWHYGFEVSGVYTWPSGSAYEGQWQNGKRHGLGMETRGRWLYRGEWTQGFKGRYGVRQSTTSTARYEGTWASGLQDGYGSETYADSGTYQGQWLRGMRHGYGVRTSAPFGLASHYKPPKQQIRASLTSLRSTDAAPGSGTVPAPTPEPTDKRDRRVDDSRGGFVLKARSDDPPARRKSLTEKSLKKGILSGLKIRKQRSTGDLEKRGTGGSIRSNASSASWMSTESSQSQASASVHTDSNASFVIEDEQMDASVTETYLGEWKNDKRTGFGISERTDGLRYEGEWFNNRKYGYGVTTFRDGSKEEGKYKNNVLITSQKKKHLFLIRSAKFRDRIENAVSAANRSSKMALQKADIAISRTATARGKAELADIAADHARQDSDLAQATARQFAPDFRQPGLERLRNRDIPKYIPPTHDVQPGKSILQKQTTTNNNNNNNNNNNSSSTNNNNNNNNNNNEQQNSMNQLIKTNDIISGGNTTSQSISQSVNQSIRRASMKTPQNNQMTSGPTGPIGGQNNYQYPNNLTSNQYGVYSGGSGGGVTEQFVGGIISGGGTNLNNTNSNLTGVGTSSYHASNVVDASNYSGYTTNSGVQQGYNNQYQQSYSTVLQQQPQSSNNQYSANVYGGQPATIPNQYDSGQNVYGAQMYQQHQQQQQYSDVYPAPTEAQRHPSVCIRRNSRILGQQDRPPGIGQTLNDRLDHYKRPPSRDSSVDRYRVPGRLIGSRQPSIDKSVTSQDAVDRVGRGASLMRSGTPLNGSAIGSGAATPVYTPPTSSQFEGALRSRGMGQEIIPSATQPKRTESLYVAPARAPPGGATGGGGGGGGGGVKDTSRTVPAYCDSTTKGHATL